jgi:hypothetical protein
MSLITRSIVESRDGRRYQLQPRAREVRPFLRLSRNPELAAPLLKVLSSGQDYEADRKRRLGADADTTQRIKYLKLTR